MNRSYLIIISLVVFSVGLYLSANISSADDRETKKFDSDYTNKKENILEIRKGIVPDARNDLVDKQVPDNGGVNDYRIQNNDFPDNKVKSSNIKARRSIFSGIINSINHYIGHKSYYNVNTIGANMATSNNEGIYSHNNPITSDSSGDSTITSDTDIKGNVPTNGSEFLEMAIKLTPFFHKKVEIFDINSIKPKKRAIAIPTKDRCEILTKLIDHIINMTLFKYYDLFLSYNGNSNSLCYTNIIDKYKDYIKESYLNDYNRFGVFSTVSYQHKYLQNKILNELGYDYVIIFESDIFPYNDCFSYFIHMENVMENDNTIFWVSAFNNHGIWSNMKSPYTFYRTDELPLTWGYMISKEKYMESLYTFFDDIPIGWDWHVNAYIKYKKFSIIFPEISRTRHLSSGVTFEQSAIEKLKLMPYSTLPQLSNYGDLSYLLQDNFDLLLQELSKNLKTIFYSESFNFDEITEPMRVIYKKTEDLPAIRNQLGIFNEGYPSIYNNYISFSSVSRKMIFFAEHILSKYVPDDFRPTIDYSAIEYITTDFYENCDKACKRHSYTCHKYLMSYINTNTTLLSEKFSCKNGVSATFDVIGEYRDIPDHPPYRFPICMIGHTISTPSCNDKSFNGKILCVCEKH